MGNIESTSEKSCNGYALILGYENFKDSTNQHREGNKFDIQRIKILMNALKVKFNVYLDLTAEDTKLKIKEVAEDERFSNYPTLTVIVLTHGNDRGILCASDGIFYTSDVWGPLKVGPNFKNKTKVLFFQACRGTQEERSMRIGGIPSNNANIQDTSQNTLPRLPHDPTFFIAFSTVENHTAFLNAHYGSWYFETLYKEIQSIINDPSANKTIELSTLLTQVNYMMVNGRNGCHSQTPCFVSFLPFQLKLPELTDPIPNIDVYSSNAGPSTSTSPDCSTSTALQRSSNDNCCGCKPDASGNKSEVKEVPSHYIWDITKSGRALIFHTKMLEKEAKEMQDTLLSLKFQVERHEINGDNFIQTLIKVSTDSELEDKNCLLVMVFAPITSNNTVLQQLPHYCEDSHIAGYNISDVWVHFIASNCIQLQEKPKIFFYLDNLDSADCPTGNTAPSNASYSEHVNDHLDFLHVFGYGKDYCKALRLHLMQGYLRQLSIEEILSASRCEAMEECLKCTTGEVVNVSRVSYHKSTLSKLLCFKEIALPSWNPVQKKKLIPGMQRMMKTIDTSFDNIVAKTETIQQANQNREEDDEADSARALVPYCQTEFKSEITQLRKFEKDFTTGLQCATVMLSGVGTLFENCTGVVGPTLEGAVSRFCQTTAETLPQLETNIVEFEEQINASQYTEATESFVQIAGKLAPAFASLFELTKPSVKK